MIYPVDSAIHLLNNWGLAFIIFSSERLQNNGGGSRFVYVIGLHADQFRNKVYSYGANLFFTRHKPDTSLALSFLLLSLLNILKEYKLHTAAIPEGWLGNVNMGP